LAAQGIPVPEVVDHAVNADVSWLVTRAVRGRSAAEPWPAGQRGAVVDSIADLARSVHALPPGRCPFDRSLAVTVPEARRAVAEGLVDLDDLDAQRQGRTAAQLLDELESTVPAGEDIVVCHGDYCLPNIMVDPGTLQPSGLVDLGRAGRADRYADVALVTRSLASSLNSQYGPAYVRRFLARYMPEGQVDTQRIEFYRLLDEFS
jgi:kanamycin kinase/aminoglycoside 3'-phosphotransferase-2